MVRLDSGANRFLAVIAFCAGAATSAIAQPQPRETPNPPLTRIADVKTSSELADQALAVQLEGAVTYVATGGSFFLHDGTMGIHVGQSETGKLLKPGDRVRVLGVTRRGSFAPSIEAREVVRLGQGQLPEARHATPVEIASGTLDGEWLELQGVARDVDFESSVPGIILTLNLDDRRLRVTVKDAETLDPESFVDAEVRVRGAVSGSFNRQRQLVEPVLRVPGPPFIQVLRRPPTDPFALPLVPLHRLLGFSLEAPPAHRIRIRGVVTRCVSDSVVFLRDRDRGLRVQARAAVLFQPGDVVDAVGFPTMSAGIAILENSLCRAVEQGAAPQPAEPDWARLLDGTHHGDLVRLRARLVDWVATTEATTLMLQMENQLFRAAMKHVSPVAVLPERDSIVDITGICEISEQDDPWHYSPRVVTLLVASPSDIITVQPPDWWTPGRLWRALAVAMILLGAGLAWVWALRRQVRRKRAVIAQQARHAAVLEERSRIARDLHDTLEQGLTGLSLQLKVVELDQKEAPEQVGPGLEAARQMLRQSRALAHQAIRELRTEETSRRREAFAAGLQRIEETWRRSGIEGVVVTIEGNARPLPRETEEQLISIAAAAVTNALKHGRASSIHVTLRYRDDGTTLEIEDNGSGFDPAQAAPPTSGGFGLVGMRERAAASGGTLEIRPRTGGGTCVVVTIPSSKGAAAGLASPSSDLPSSSLRSAIS